MYVGNSEYCPSFASISEYVPWQFVIHTTFDGTRGLLTSFNVAWERMRKWRRRRRKKGRGEDGEEEGNDNEEYEMEVDKNEAREKGGGGRGGGGGGQRRRGKRIKHEEFCPTKSFKGQCPSLC